MNRANYLRGWLLLPLLVGASAWVVTELVGPELPEPALSILLFLTIGFMFGAIPYGFSLVLIWKAIPTWGPRKARAVAILLPWAWCVAGWAVLAWPHLEHAPEHAGIPWFFAIPIAVWAIAVLLLERFFVADAELAAR